jgi:UDP-N-acetylglucosamine 4-epimerase
MRQYKILVTGGAGFIGSNIVASLASHPAVDKIIVLDNLSTGYEKNLVKSEKISFYQGDIRDYTTCLEAAKGIDVICHQAALGSVPRSIQNPLTTHDVNVNGTLTIFQAAKESGIKKVVFASSSSVYGDNADLPKQEDKIGTPLSPYAVTKQVGELYAKVFSQTYHTNFIGLRYFNVFGPNQDPHGTYAAVVPLFILNALNGLPSTINGDGLQSRDFTHVSNVVQANLKCIFSEDKNAWNQLYNIACGSRASVLDLYDKIQQVAGTSLKPIMGASRSGDIPHSLADICKAKRLIHFNPTTSLEEGLKLTFDWFKNKLAANAGVSLISNP